MPELKAVLFDLYDTLVWSSWTDQAMTLGARLGVAPDLVAAAYEELRDLRDGGAYDSAEAVLAAVIEYCGGEPDPDLIGELASRETDLLAESVMLYDDSLPVLRRLRADGIRTGVVSNCSPSTRPVVDRLGLEDEAQVVVLSCEVGAAKPDPVIFRTAVDALGVRSERSLFVDDRPEYLDGAARLGMQTAQIVRNPATVELSESHSRVTDLHQLLDRLA